MNVTGIASGMGTNVEMSRVQAGASFSVLKMADEVVTEACAQLLNMMDAMLTGLGQNIDMYA